MPRLTAKLIALALIVSVSLGVGAMLPRGSVPVMSRDPLGERLDTTARLVTMEGKYVSVRRTFADSATIVYLFGPEHCAGCANLPLEFRILREQFPGLRPLLVGTGAPRSRFAPSIQAMQLSRQALVDENGDILRTLGVSQPPLVMIVDTSLRIILVDRRSVPAAARYPMGRVLHDLSNAITPDATR